MVDDDQKKGTPALEARYTNCIKVGYNAVEFIFDFGQFYTTDEQPRFHTRIAAAPLYAQSFAETLRTSLTSYEETYGPIPPADSCEEDTN